VGCVARYKSLVFRSFLIGTLDALEVVLRSLSKKEQANDSIAGSHSGCR
jgi:hypothetical protein